MQLNLNRPKTTIIINETFDQKTIPHLKYDARLVQDRLDTMDGKFVVIEKDNQMFAIPEKIFYSRNVSSQKNYCTLKGKLKAPSKHPLSQANTPKKCAPDFMIGVLFGSFNRNHKNFSNDVKSKQGLAAALVAFGYSYVIPEIKWTLKILDDVIILANTLYKKSVNESNCVNIEDEKISYKFSIDDVRLEIYLSDPITIGLLRSQQTDVPNFQTGLKQFFLHFKSAVIKINSQIFLIWKKRSIYYFYDSNGRTRECQKDIENGLSVLLTFNSYKNLITLILEMSELTGNFPYAIYNIQVKKICRTKNPKATLGTNPENEEISFFVVNDQMAVLQASSQLTKPKHCLGTSTAAIICSRIKQPNYWNKNDIDKVLVLGLECPIIVNSDLKPTTIQTIKVGPLVVKLKVYPMNLCGEVVNKKCVPIQLIDFFAAKPDGTGLLQLDNEIYSIWIQNGLYYLFVSFPRNKLGEPIKTNEKCGAACLQMHSTLLSLWSVVSRNLINDKDLIINFHTVQVLSIENTQNMSGLLLPPIKRCVEADEQAKVCDLDSPRMSREQMYGLLQKCSTYLNIQTQVKNICNTTVERIVKDVLKIVGKDHSSSCLCVDCEGKCETVCEPSPCINCKCKPEEIEIKVDIVDSETMEERQKKKNQKSISSKINKDGKLEPAENLTEKILIKTDLDQLKLKRWKICDNVSLDRPINNDKIKETFEKLPDGSAIIYGAKINQHQSQSPVIDVLKSIAAIIISSRIRMEKWTQITVDYVNTLGHIIEKRLTDVEASNIFKYPIFKFPQIKFGSLLIDVNLERIVNGEFSNLHELIKMSFEKTTTIVIISLNYCLAVLRASKYYYLFTGYPCDRLGFRNITSTQGQSCMMRFNCLHDVTRRILFNKIDGTLRENFVVSEVIFENYPLKWCKMNEMEEQAEIDRITMEENKCRDKRIKVDEQIKAEKERISQFTNVKLIKYKGDDLKISSSKSAESTIADSSEAIVQSDDTILGHPSGYQLCNVDNLFKIQGTTALHDRCTETDTPVRTCFFTGIYAILFVIHRPLHHWDYRCIDRCIEQGREIIRQSKDLNILSIRSISNVLLEEYSYNVLIKQIDVRPVTNSQNYLSRSLKEFFKKQKYVLIHFPTTSFVIMKDAEFHCFDSYRTLEFCEKQEESFTLVGVPKNISLVEDNNTASWIMLPDLDYVVKYLKQRVKKDEIGEFKLFTVNITSYKKIMRNSFEQFLIGNSEFSHTRKTNYGIEPSIQNEKILWLEIDKQFLPPWSRVRTHNLANQQRHQPCSMWYDFDIEIPNDLYSLWGNIHPMSSLFGKCRNKQHMGIGVVAAQMASLYKLDAWSDRLIDGIVINGDRYFRESVENIKEEDYRFELLDLKKTFQIEKINFKINIEQTVYGSIYCTDSKYMNLSKALVYFFTDNQHGILLSADKILTIGRDRNSDYFLFDSQSFGRPLFNDNKQGCAYVLRCRTISRLLHSIVITLNIQRYNVEFNIHKITMKMDGIQEGEYDKRVSSDDSLK